MVNIKIEVKITWKHIAYGKARPHIVHKCTRHLHTNAHFFLGNQKSEMGQHLYNLNGKKSSFKNPIALWNYSKLKAAQFMLIETIPNFFTKVKIIYIEKKNEKKSSFRRGTHPIFFRYKQPKAKASVVFTQYPSLYDAQRKQPTNHCHWKKLLGNHKGSSFITKDPSFIKKC